MPVGALPGTLSSTIRMPRPFAVRTKSSKVWTLAPVIVLSYLGPRSSASISATVLSRTLPVPEVSRSTLRSW